MTQCIRPAFSGWDFARRERELYASAKEIPTWRVANQARRMLADVTHQLSNAMPTPDATHVDDLSRAVASQIACVQLSAVVVRSAGSILSLISCGYEREALAPARTTLEAVLRGRQMNDDMSGEVARKILKGHRPPKSLRSVAQRYGEEGDVEFLDRFAHADILSLSVLSIGGRADASEAERDIELRPRRGVAGPANQLFSAAHQTVGFSVILGEAFGVGIEVPGWISGQLQHYQQNPLPAIL